MLVGTVKHETLNIIEKTVSTYNIFKGRIFEEEHKGTACALGSEKCINRRTRLCSTKTFRKWEYLSRALIGYSNSGYTGLLTSE